MPIDLEVSLSIAAGACEMNLSHFPRVDRSPVEKQLLVEYSNFLETIREFESDRVSE